MTPVDTTYLVLFAANLAFIVTHLYGWLLKGFWKPEAYRENFNELFPAQRSVSIIYLMQLCELPYLLHVGDSDTLLYVNAFALLFFSLQMYYMCEGYFFPRTHRPLREYWVVLPAVVVLLPMFLQAVNIVRLPDGWRVWAVGGVSLLFVYYFWRNIRMALRIKHAVQCANEERYADSDDFPVQFANLIRWVPTGILILLAVNFYAENVWVKFARDILFIFANVWFCLLTLNPWRKAANEELGMRNEELADASTTSNLRPPTSDLSHLLSDSRYDELARKLDKLLTEEHIFTQPHITIDTLISHLGTNSKYLTEVIRRSGYQSFYDMISLHRVRHAISLIHQHPEALMADIAADCGFSSPASMAKAFKSQGKDPPSTFR